MSNPAHHGLDRRHHIEAARQIAPHIVVPGVATRTKRWLPAIVVVGVLVWALDGLGFFSGGMLQWSEIGGRMVAGLFQPSHGGQVAQMFSALLETLAMAVAGTVLAVLLALPLGFIGSKTIIPNTLLHGGIRLVYDILRAIPALIWTIIMIRAFGLGPMAGVVALALAEAPYLAKLYAEMLENADRTPVTALRASGAGPLQAIRFGLVPQVLPNFAGMALFFFEVNVRAAAALGVVGAGGIGQMLQERIAFALFDQVAFIILMLLALVAVVDTVSGRLRRKLMGNKPIYLR